MKTYTRKEIEAWLEEYSDNPDNHINCECLIDKDIECDHDLGEAGGLFDFIIDKLTAEG